MGPTVLSRLTKSVGSFIAGGAFLASSYPTWAHHSYAMFDHNDVVTVSGTIGAIQWMNPHVWVWVYVPTAQGGGYALYGFESNTVNHIARLGWHKGSLQVGDKVSIKYFPLWHHDRNVGYFIEAQRSDGSIVVGDTAAYAMTEASKYPELEISPPKDIVPPK